MYKIAFIPAPHVSNLIYEQIKLYKTLLNIKDRISIMYSLFVTCIKSEWDRIDKRSEYVFAT